MYGIAYGIAYGIEGDTAVKQTVIAAGIVVLWFAVFAYYGIVGYLIAMVMLGDSEIVRELTEILGGLL